MKNHLPILGFTYIELITSILLLSLILLGVDAMAIVALRQTTQAWNHAVAINQAINMQERLHAFGNAELTNQVRQWNVENSRLLPQGKGMVRGQYPDFSIQISWKNHDSEKTENIEEKVSV